MSTLVPKKEDPIKITPARQALKQFTGRDYVVNGLEASYSGLTITLTAGSVILSGCYIEYSQSTNITVPANSSGFIKCRIVTNSSNEPIDADIIQETSSTDGEFKLTLWQYTSSDTTITSLTDLRPKRITAKRELITSSQSLYKRNCLLYIVAVGGGGKGTSFQYGHGGPVLADYTYHYSGYISITIGTRNIQNMLPTITTVTTSFETLSTSPADGGVFVTHGGVTATNGYRYSGDMKALPGYYVKNIIIENPQLFISGYGDNSPADEMIIFRGAGFLGSAAFLSTIKSAWNYGKGGDPYFSGTDGAVLIYSWEDLY